MDKVNKYILRLHIIKKCIPKRDMVYIKEICLFSYLNIQYDNSATSLTQLSSSSFFSVEKVKGIPKHYGGNSSVTFDRC